jgi:hypothetical protein
LGQKRCSWCKEVKDCTEFYSNVGTNDGYGSWCKKCDRNERRRKRREKKRIITELAGNRCCRCGYNKCIGALEFHHRDGKKEFALSKTSYSLERMIEESRKCILLCANCHREEHVKNEEYPELD